MRFNFLRKPRRNKAVSMFVPKEVLDDTLAGNGMENFHEMKDAKVEYVLVVVRGETPEMISMRMGEVARIAEQHKGVIDSLISSLVVVTYGLLNFETDDIGNLLTLVEALKQELGPEIKIVHGVEQGHFGYVGSEARSSFSFIVPGFMNALNTLALLSFGETEEIATN